MIILKQNSLYFSRHLPSMRVAFWKPSAHLTPSVVCFRCELPDQADTERWRAIDMAHQIS
jgi:hypothetical protein